MSNSSPANGRHVVRIESENVIDIPGGSGRQLGQTYYRGLFFEEGEVVQAWAMETFERSPAGGSQRGITINTYKDGSTTVMSFEGDKSYVDGQTRNGFDGRWKFVGGSGRFTDIRGSGTYEGESYDGIAYSNVTGTVG